MKLNAAKESLSERFDMKIYPSMKKKLQELANKDRRELSDFIRLKLEDVCNGTNVKIKH